MAGTTFQDFAQLRFLLSIEGIGPVKIRNLISAFHSFDNILEADTSSLSDVNGIGIFLAKKLTEAKKTIPAAFTKFEKEFSGLHSHGVRAISFFDEDYPDLLKKIYDPPIILYVKGEFVVKDDFPIAIVGTRQPTTYGKIHAEKFSSELATQGITIASGLARGIDSIAHQAALKANGRTIAVLGCGINVIYPPENKKLYEEIPNAGLLISEFPLGTKPDAQNFPSRNRIISGLSLGCVVIESGIQGGALQTAEFALDQGREVFAIPGNLGVKQAEGTNTLIQQGSAKLVKNPEDILIELELKLKPVIGKTIPKPQINLNLFEQKILAVLAEKEMQIDNIATETGLSTSDCLVNLLTLEFNGLVKQLPGKVFIAT